MWRQWVSSHVFSTTNKRNTQRLWHSCLYLSILPNYYHADVTISAQCMNFSGRLCNDLKLFSLSYQMTRLCYFWIEMFCDILKDCIFSVVSHFLPMYKWNVLWLTASLWGCFLICKWKFSLPSRVVIKIINNVFKSPNIVHETQ